MKVSKGRVAATAGILAFLALAAFWLASQPETEEPEHDSQSLAERTAHT